MLRYKMTFAYNLTSGGAKQMKNIVIDFYSAFEEDDGIVLFSNSDNILRKIIIWEGFFWKIIEKLEPTPMIGDELNDLIRIYNYTMQASYRNEPYQVLNLEIILLQLQGMKSDPDTSNQIYYDADNRILSEMIILISEAIEKKISVYMQGC
jgi:hypothetical protein